MNRYLVFAYDTYYPRGGMGDMRGSFETIQEAIDFLNEALREHDPDRDEYYKRCYDNGEVFDCETRQVIYEA